MRTVMICSAVRAVVRRPIVALVLAGALALSLASAVPAQAMYQYVQGLTADGCNTCAASYLLPSDSSFPAFRTGEPTHLFRMWVPYNYYATWNGSSCAYTSNAYNGWWGSNDPIVQSLGTLHSDGIVPVVQFIGQPNPNGDYNTWAADTTGQRCSVTWMMNALGHLGYLLPGSLAINFEGYNEPDLNWPSAQQAADFTINDVWGGQASSYGSSAGYLAGSFGGGSNQTYDNDYYNELGTYNVLNDISAWSFHDYNDPNSSETLNWCTDGTYSGNPYGSQAYAGCDHSEISPFASWAGGKPYAYPIWITETAGALTLGCWSGVGCGAYGNHSPWADARAATDIEYLEKAAPRVTEIMWDHYGPDAGDNGWWDAGLVEPGADCLRASWDVLAEHDSTATAISDAQQRGCTG